MPKQALITSRDGKGLGFTRLVEAAYDGARLNKGEAQNVNQQPDEIKRGIRELLERLRKPRPVRRLISNRYQQERESFDFEFQVSAGQTLRLSHFMLNATSPHIPSSGQVCYPMVFTPIWSPEVRSNGRAAEPVFLGYMIIANDFKVYVALIADVKKIDEGMDSEVRFNVKVTVSEFAR